MESWSDRWNIKIDEAKTQAIYFSHQWKPIEFRITLNGRKFPFVDHVKYLGVISEKRIPWRLHENVHRQGLQKVPSPLFNCRLWSITIKLTLHKTLIRSVTTYACPAWEFAAHN
jgi:hypothetical protein